MISPGETCRVVNQEDYDVPLRWDNQVWNLSPGVETIVPSDAVIIEFGDPRSSQNIEHVKTLKGADSWVPDRASEVRRLRVRYANIDGPEDKVIAPNVKVMNALGEEFLTVVQDPSGQSVNPATFTMDQQSTVYDIMERQQNELDELRKLVELGKGDTAFDSTFVQEGDLLVDDGEDLPRREPNKVEPTALMDDEN